MPLLKTIDVAHPPRRPDDVEQELADALSSRSNPSVRLVKVVHGYGSTGKGGSTKEVVRNWTFRNRKRVRAVFEGERYTLFEPEVQEMRKEVGQYTDTDLQQGNPGITVLWLR